MTEYNPIDLVKQLRRLGITIDIMPLSTTLIGHDLYATGTTFETALARFLQKTFEELESLRRWKEDTRQIVTDWSEEH